MTKKIPSMWDGLEYSEGGNQKEPPTQKAKQDFKFKIGDWVRVGDIRNNQYHLYTSWFEENGLGVTDAWEEGKLLEEGGHYQVINCGIHKNNDSKVYHVSFNGENSFLISEEGLTLVDEGSNITLTEYDGTKKVDGFKGFEVPPTVDDIYKIVPSAKETYEYEVNLNRTGENNMTNKLRTVNITLVDNNTNLKGEAKVVFQKLNYLTEYSDEDTKVNIIATGKVAKALTEHNEEVRAKTVDDTILRSTGRDVPLKPIELLSDSQLSWNIVTIA